MSATKPDLTGRVLFLSGPCRGYENHNKELFELAESKLAEAAHAAGFAGDTPADQFTVTAVHTHQPGIYQDNGTFANLKAAFEMSDATVMLPGFARKGATIEDLLATISYDKPVFFFDPDSMAFVLMSPDNITLKPVVDPFSTPAE